MAASKPKKVADHAFPECLRRLMDELDLEVKDLVNNAYVDERTVRYWLSGEKLPTQRRFRDLGIALFGRDFRDHQKYLVLRVAYEGDQRTRQRKQRPPITVVKPDGAKPTNARPQLKTDTNGRAQQILHPEIRPVPGFAGRADLLDAIDRALWQQGGAAALTNAQAAAVHGLGGVGKSVLAQEYAWRNRARYRGAWWLRAETEQTLIDDLIALGSRLIPNLEAIPERDRAARLALDAIEQPGAETPWLLVYDNAEKPGALGTLTPRSGAHRLITSRWPRWQGHAEALAVDVFPPEVAVDFLMTGTTHSDRDAAARLAEALGRLPLALDEAREYCALHNIGFNRYLEQTLGFSAKVFRSRDFVTQDARHNRISPFVFLSYKREDAAQVGRIRDALIAQGIDVWWDEEIPLNSNFRAHILEKLESAACVLSLWSTRGIESEWMHDEAQRGLERDRYIQASIDGNRPPLPFGARQLVDLSRWNGDSNAPEIQSIVRGIRALFGQIDTPGKRDVALRKGVAQKARIAAVTKGGRVHLTETPHEVPKKSQTSAACQLLLREQTARAHIVIKNLMRSQKNFNKDLILPQLKDYLGALQADDPDYIEVGPAMEVLEPNLRDEFVQASFDEGLLNLFNQLLRIHPDVIKAIRRTGIDPEDAVGPALDENAAAAIDIEALTTKALAELASGELEGAIDDSAYKALRVSAELIHAGQAESPNEQPARRNLRRRMFRRGVIGAAGVLGALGSAASLSGLTAPEALAALIARLEPIWHLISRLFT